MFVSIAIMRRGTAAAGAANAGRIESSRGNAIATPAPRRNVRRDRGLGGGVQGSDIGRMWLGESFGEGL